MVRKTMSFFASLFKRDKKRKAEESFARPEECRSILELMEKWQV